jgi:hypothetical protein
MATIIAGLFDTTARAEGAVRRLLELDCPRDHLSTFSNNPPGQHAKLPMGGDESADPEAKGAQGNAVKGAALGAGVGAVGGAIGGPVTAAAGAAVGAYVGSLAGALGGVGKKSHGQYDQGTLRRPAGVMVAINANGCAAEDRLIATLRESGAVCIEKTEGEWRDGQWLDFDPVAPPRLVQSVETAR